jgi:HEAT repeat protein
LGREAAEVVPALVEALADEDGQVRRDAEEALRAMPWARVQPSLVEALGDRRAVLRASGASLLGWYEEKAREALPALLKLRGDESPEVRCAVLAALGRIDPEAKEVEAALLSGLEDEKPVRWGVAEVLGQQGERGAAAIPILLRWLEGKDEEERRRAVWALVRVGPADKRVASALLELLEEREQPHMQGIAAVALARVRPRAAVVPALVVALEGKGMADARAAVAVRKCVVRALADMGTDARPAAAALVAVLKDKGGDAELRRAAVQALGEVGLTSEAREAVREALSDADEGVRLAAGKVLR